MTNSLEQTTHSLAESDAKAHFVKQSENLWKIAHDELKQEGHTPSNRDIANAVRRLTNINKLTNPDHLDINQKLMLPRLDLYNGATTTFTPAEDRSIAPGGAVDTPPNPTPITPPALEAPPPNATPARVEAAPPIASDQPPAAAEHHSQHPGAPDNTLDFIESLASGAVGKFAATKLLETGFLTAEKLPWIPAKIIGFAGATIIGSTAARELIDEASHLILHTERHTQAQLIAQGAAGAGGSLIGKYAPEIFGKSATKFWPSTLVGGSEFSTVNAGLVNPLATNPETGKHYTLGETGVSAGTAFLGGAAVSGLTYYPSKVLNAAAGASWRGVKGVANVVKSKL